MLKYPVLRKTALSDVTEDTFPEGAQSGFVSLVLNHICRKVVCKI